MNLIRLLTAVGALVVLGACTGLAPADTQAIVQPASKAAAEPPVTGSMRSRLYDLAKPADTEPTDLQPGTQRAPADRFSLESTPGTRLETSVFQEFERGGASWYGPGLHGRRTANGERYDMHALTAAHRTLPFGTIVRVRSLVNGREVEVRITDRGPFVRSRVIDVSRAAAVELGMIGLGIKNVALLRLGHESRAVNGAESGGAEAMASAQNLSPRAASGAFQTQVVPTAFGDMGARAPALSSPTRRVIRHRQALPSVNKPAVQKNQHR